MISHPFLRGRNRLSPACIEAADASIAKRMALSGPDKPRAGPGFKACRHRQLNSRARRYPLVFVSLSASTFFCRGDRTLHHYSSGKQNPARPPANRLYRLYRLCRATAPVAGPLFPVWTFLPWKRRQNICRYALFISGRHDQASLQE